MPQIIFLVTIVLGSFLILRDGSKDLTTKKKKKKDIEAVEGYKFEIIIEEPLNEPGLSRRRYKALKPNDRCK